MNFDTRRKRRMQTSLSHPGRPAGAPERSPQPCRIKSPFRKARTFLRADPVVLLLAALVASFACSVAASRTAFALGGWEYLIARLVRDGEPRADVERIFRDPRMPPFAGLEFSPHPRPESPALYRAFLRPQGVREARACWQTHRAALERAASRTGVPATLLAALLYVESRCGAYTGNHRVLYRLARLAMAPAPENFAHNLGVWLQGAALPPRELERTLAQRARYLEDTFYPEVRATLQVARWWNVDPLELRGSPAGALGWPQFLPRSVLRFGRDANGDGHVNLFDAADAALSAAEFLHAYGWGPGLSATERRRVLWNYNRSAAYGDTVLALQRRLDGGATTAADRDRKPPSRVARKPRAAPGTAAPRHHKSRR